MKKSYKAIGETKGVFGEVSNEIDQEFEVVHAETQNVPDEDPQITCSGHVHVADNLKDANLEPFIAWNRSTWGKRVKDIPKDSQEAQGYTRGPGCGVSKSTSRGTQHQSINHIQLSGSESLSCDTIGMTVGMPKKKKARNQYPWEQLPIEKTFTPEAVDIEIDEAVTPSDVEDLDDLRGSFKLLRSSERTLVFAIVTDKERDDSNSISAIKCFGGTAVGGYAYDRGRDCYIVRCVEFLQVGQIPFSYIMTMDNVGDWQVKVPIPETILEKHFTPQQKKNLADYRNRWPAPRFEIHFVQMLGCI